MIGYAEREAMTKVLYAKPEGPDLPTQKFKRGSKVHICKNMPKSMFHFENNFDAIVEYTYAQKYGGNNIDSYSVIVLNDSGQPINSIAWYHENQLSLLDDDIEVGKKIIEKYKNGL